MQQLIKMIEEAVANGNVISVFHEGRNTISCCSFIPYEYDFNGQIRIEGERCVLNITNLNGMDIFYDEFENEFHVHFEDEDIYITILDN